MKVIMPSRTFKRLKMERVEKELEKAYSTKIIKKIQESLKINTNNLKLNINIFNNSTTLNKKSILKLSHLLNFNANLNNNLNTIIKKIRIMT